MTLLVGGAVAAVLGLIGFFFWWHAFLTILMGGVPILLFLGGILAIYIGFDELQETLQEERRKQDENLAKAREEIELVRAQADQYKEELEKLKEGNKTE